LIVVCLIELGCGLIKITPHLIESIERLEQVLFKFNPYHDSGGRFASGSGSGAHMAPDTGGGSGGVGRGKDPWEKDPEGWDHSVVSSSATAPIDAFKEAVKNSAPGVKMTISKSRTDSGYIVRSVTLEPKEGGFFSTAIWSKRPNIGGKWEHIFQQQDISLPESARGKGIGGKMMAALVAGYKRVGVTNVPVHMDTNPSFWDHMRQKYPGVFSG